MTVLRWFPKIWYLPRNLGYWLVVYAKGSDSKVSGSIPGRFFSLFLPLFLMLFLSSSSVMELHVRLSFPCNVLHAV